MTIDEKIGQLMQFNANVLMDTSADVTGPLVQSGLTGNQASYVGSVLNFKTPFPIPLGLGCSFNPELVGEAMKMSAREAVAGGVQVTFTPMVDYVRDARWGVLWKLAVRMYCLTALWEQHK